MAYEDDVIFDFSGESDDSSFEPNPNPRVPVALVLDTSGSMQGMPISELNDGIKLFFEAVKSDEVAASSVEVAVITFGGVVSVLLDFNDIEHQTVPVLSAGGGTPMGEAVYRALTLLDRRKEKYKRNGIDYYQPWMVLMTDGQPTDDITLATQRASELANARKLTIFPICIGPNADCNVLSRFSPRKQPLRLKELNFKEFFEWLSKSVTKVSYSNPGETVPLAPPTGWAEV